MASYLQQGDTTYYVANNGQQYPIDGQGRPFDPTTQFFLGSADANAAGLPSFVPVTNSNNAPTNPATTGSSLPGYMATTITDPLLPQGGVFTPTLASADTQTLQQTGQLMQQNNPATQIGAQAPVAAPQPVTAPTITAQQGTATTVDPNAPAALVNPTAASYQATTTTGQAPQATAQQGIVSANALVSEQLKKLYSESQPGMIPEWARGAVVAANEQMAARGLGASTIGVAATAAAIQASALPIASQDANSYFQMDIKNLDNRQQTELANLQVRQQALLSDQAAQNAAAQFNASSQSQTQQFLATLMSTIQQQNADRLTAMSQFNAGQSNQMSVANATNEINVNQFNAQQKSVVDQFNAQMNYARDQFNAQAAFAIEQSNVTWRRSINTANTAAINAANQTNVQNRFNMSQQAQNALWQQWRDEASWAWQSNENELNRQYNMALAANGQYAGNEDFDWGKAAGSFVSGLFT